MLGYVAKRILATIPVMLIVAVFVFLMLRLTPGDPAAVIAGDYATTEDVERIREQLGLNGSASSRRAISASRSFPKSRCWS